MPPKLYGESPPIQQLRSQLERVAPTPLPVLITGDTGTGKEVAARYLHEHSRQRQGPFVAVDCAAISHTLVETELFGHERGAFTGAHQQREGLVAAANGGTFFLDEVAELPLPAQTRLLRLLQEGTYRPVGAQEPRRAQIRVVAATWQNLSSAVQEGRFRRDLYHRLSVVELHLPPLRERPGDLQLLLNHFITDISARLGRQPPIPDGAVRRHLEQWPWPGNVRELRNTAEYLCAMTRGPRIGLKDLPSQLSRPAPSVSRGPALPQVRTDLPYIEARRIWLDTFQQLYVNTLLAEHDGNITMAARAADMDRRSIQRILSRARELALDRKS